MKEYSAERALSTMFIDEHRGAPGIPRKPAPYVSNPYDISPPEFRRAQQRIKQEYKQRNRDAQKKLNREIVDRLRRKASKYFSLQSQKKAQIQDLTSRYNRARIDREHGGTPGAWRSDEPSRYPDA